MYIPDLYIYCAIALLSLIIIMKSAGYVIQAIADYARITGLSEYLIGSLVVAIGTSLPELTAAIISSLTAKVTYVNGQLITTNTLSLGNVIGANVIDVSLVLGAMAIIGKKIEVRGKLFDKTILGVMVITFLPLFVGIDGIITRIEGFVLIFGFLTYVYFIFKREGKFGELKKNIYWKDVWQDMVIVIGCLIALLLSAAWLVKSAEMISSIANISNLYIGMVLLAVATTVPELTVSIASIVKGTSGIAFGDIIGSVIMNSSMVLGCAAVIHPLHFVNAPFVSAMMFMGTCVFIALLFIQKQEVTWEEGIGLLLLYATFLATQALPA